MRLLTRTPTADASTIAGAASLAALGLVLWPITQNWRTRKRDSFPLSYYPMFSARRAERVQIYHLVGITATGERRPIVYRLCGTGGLNQVRRQLRQLMREGWADELCERVAHEIARERSGAHADVVAVEAVRTEYNLVGYFSGDKRPLAQKHYATRQVVRAA